MDDRQLNEETKMQKYKEIMKKLQDGNKVQLSSAKII